MAHYQRFTLVTEVIINRLLRNGKSKIATKNDVRMAHHQHLTLA